MEEQFYLYEAIRESGKFNMIMDWVQICNLYNFDPETYKYIISHYSELRDKYMSE